MAANNPFQITYGGQAVGGTSDRYQLNGPYILEKSYDTFSLVFEVVVVATSYATLNSYSATLEAAFRKRDQDLEIDLDVLANPGTNRAVYTFGNNILKTISRITKTGNAETDHGYSRAYTISIDAELPADDDAGLRMYEANISFLPSRQAMVSVHGEYTANSSSNAYTLYATDFPNELSGILAFFGPGVSWEKVDEQVTISREQTSGTPNPHSCQFSQQHVQLLYPQTSGTTNNSQIKDHRVSFTDLSQFPGDSSDEAHRFRRVVGTYEASLDITATTNLKSTYESLIRPYILSEFRSTFSPSQFGIEDIRATFDETSKRFSASLQFLYVKTGGENIIESTLEVTVRENQDLKPTPIHDGGLYSYYIDKGWATRERITQRSATVLGAASPAFRIGPEPRSGVEYNDPRDLDNTIPNAGRVGATRDNIAGNADVVDDGWNIIQNTSSIQPRFIGEPDEQQVMVTIINDTIIELYTEKPSATSGGQ